MYPIGPGKMPGWACIGFFMAQSVGMMVERVFRAVTGRRVGGWMGTIWVWCWIVGGGQLCSELSFETYFIPGARFTDYHPLKVDSWYRSGFNSGVYVPPSLSPTKLI